MAVPNGSADETTIYEALVVDRYSDVDWQEYLRARSRADDGRDPVGAEVATDGGQLERPDEDVELPDLHVGDHVKDRDDPHATMIVVGLPPETADEYEVDGTPLTEYNHEYPADDAVVEVVYPQRGRRRGDREPVRVPPLKASPRGGAPRSQRRRGGGGEKR